LAVSTLFLNACALESREKVEASAASSEMVQATVWKRLEFVVRGSKTQLESNGHFKTLPNACYRREYGAFELPLWNRLAQALNRLMASPEAPELQCYPRPAGAADLNQAVRVELQDQRTQEVLSPQGSKYCTRFSDQASAEELLVVLTEAAHRASIEGCPLRERSSSETPDHLQPATANDSQPFESAS
jgi:hypothetical protein